MARRLARLLAVLAAGLLAVAAFGQGTLGEYNNRISRGYFLRKDQQTPPGGTAKQVQYNADGGAFGGTSYVQTDGAHLLRAAETAHPAAPTGNFALQYLYEQTDAGFPLQPIQIDNYMGLPVPYGLNGAAFSEYGAVVNWNWGCAVPDGWTQTATVQWGSMVAPSGTGTGSSPAWDATSLIGRLKELKNVSSASTNSTCGQRAQRFLFWRGNTAGAGGFLFWMRFELDKTQATIRVFAGVLNSLALIGAAVDPNSVSDTIYVGANAGDANLSICSNDNSGSATCNTLGNSFPAQTDGAFYDLWLAGSPNGGSVGWYVERLDSPAVASGTLTSDLPRNSVQLSWQLWVNTGSTATTVQSGWLGSCFMGNM